jgi:hypothetical protein
LIVRQEAIYNDHPSGTCYYLELTNPSIYILTCVCASSLNAS